MATAQAQARLEVASGTYQKIQAELQQLVGARGRLDAQRTENEAVRKRTENEAVRKEFAALAPANEVFKLVGPVLVKQDAAEARANVNKRLEFIASEITRVDGQIGALEKQADAARNEIAQLQGTLQGPAQPQGVAAA